MIGIGIGDHGDGGRKAQERSRMISASISARRTSGRDCARAASNSTLPGFTAEE
jgi:hypothetical protein